MIYPVSFPSSQAESSFSSSQSFPLPSPICRGLCKSRRIYLGHRQARHVPLTQDNLTFQFKTLSNCRTAPEKMLELLCCAMHPRLHPMQPRGTATERGAGRGRGASAKHPPAHSHPGGHMSFTKAKGPVLGLQASYTPEFALATLFLLLLFFTRDNVSGGASRLA